MILFVSFSFAQVKKNERRIGTVSYISIQHVYVKFESTDSLHAGDTLFFSKGGVEIPVVIVKFISSKSCAGENISKLELKPDDKLIAYFRIIEPQPKAVVRNADTADKSIPAKTVETSKPQKKYSRKNLWGKFTVQSLSSYSNAENSNNQRWRYSSSLNADSIGGSGFSFSGYLFFAYNNKDWSEIKNNIGDALKIYDFSVGYTFNNRDKIWLGRYLNPRIANVGSIDGLQFQKQLGDYYLGAVVGSHPDFSDYGYNIKMFEYGGYFGRVDTFSSSQMENSVAFMNQTNNFTTDRRYIYFQHSNNLISNTNFFISTEFDLYQKENGTPTNKINLTSLYASVYLTPLRFISLSLSFDARRNTIYYETYKNYLESLLSNELRKGYRVTLFLRPTNNIFISMNGGCSFQSSDPKPSSNYGANIYYSEIPFLDISTNISFSKLSSSYTNGTISGIRLNKYLNAMDLNLSANYQHTKYEFDFGSDPMVQNIVSGEISFKLPFDLYFGLNYEGVFESSNTYGRFYIDLTKRF